MSLYLDTRGNTNVAIAVCDRCKLKCAIVDLVPDPNSPGLRVHEHCKDQFDPWRLPARPPDNLTVNYPRPDLPLTPD